MVYTGDLKSPAFGLAGSNPASRTKFNIKEYVVRKLDLEEVRQFIENQTPETKIYIGCDSERFNIGGLWYADYVLAIVVHINGNNGCKLFGEVQRERDYDQKVNRPRYRLMTEVYKLSELYIKLADVLEGRDVEVHLDINTQKSILDKFCLPQF